VAFSFLWDERFYVSDRRGHPLERAARGILLGSVDTSIRFDLYNFTRSDAMLRAIKGRFGTISRATQLSRWRDLFHLAITADTNANEVSSLYRSRFDDLLASGIPLSRDAILGLILQSSIPHGTDLRNEFDQRMDMELSWNNNAAPRFDRVIDLLSASISRLSVRARDRQQDMVPQMLATDAPMRRSSSIESHPGNVYGMAGQPERRPENRLRTCFRCGSAAHQIAECTEPPRQSRQPLSHSYRAHPDQFTAHYPIITPPTGYRQPAPPCPPPNPAQAAPAPGLRPADSYRPDYRRTGGRPAARQAEINDGDSPAAPEDAMEYEEGPGPAPDARNAEFSFPSPPPEALFDTGATHHLSGDKSALHHLQLLSKPIPLKVATNTSSHFITAIGTLVFHGPNSTLIELRGVLYCPDATNTLISPAALRLAGFTMSYDCRDDSFNIFSGRTLWAKSVLNPRSRKWLFPSPLPFVPSVSPLPRNLPSVSTVKPLLSDPISSVATVKPTTVSSRLSSPTVHSLSVLPTFVGASTAEQDNEVPFVYNVPEAVRLPGSDPKLTSDERELLLIHLRLGHVSLRVIRRMIKYQVGLGLPSTLPPGQIHCPTCMIAKSIHKNSLSSTQRTFFPMDLWNVDLIGPFEMEATGGGKYILTIRDIGSGYGEIKILQLKSDTTKFLIDAITCLERQTGRPLKAIRSDNGGEFNNHALANYL
jgi:hypothetical protein